MFFKYILVGILNTALSFSIIFILMLCKISPEVSNLIGYICGICFSYFMNKKFTFNFQKEHKFFSFILVMFFAYILNFITLKICINLNINPFISQIIAGVIYTVSGFLLNKYWVFKKNI